MGYTRDQLEAMGATPVTPGGSSPSAPATTASKKKYTLQELQAMGAKPVTATPLEAPKGDWLSTAAGITDAIFGAGKIGEAFGAQSVKNNIRAGTQPGIIEADYNKLSPEAIARLKAKGVPTTAQAQRNENADTVEMPSTGQILGSTAQVGVNFLPIGRIAKGIGTAGKALGLGEKLAKFTGNVGAGATTGYGYDVATNFAQDNENKFTPGGGTAIGAAIPFVPPVLRGVGHVAGDALGVATGAGEIGRAHV